SSVSSARFLSPSSIALRTPLKRSLVSTSPTSTEAIRSQLSGRYFSSSVRPELKKMYHPSAPRTRTAGRAISRARRRRDRLRRGESDGGAGIAEDARDTPTTMATGAGGGFG